MNKWNRPRRAGATETFSVSVDPVNKRALRELADHDYGGNLSALVNDLAEDARRRMAAARYLDRHGIPVLTPSEAADLETEIAGEVTAWRTPQTAHRRVIPVYVFDSAALLSAERGKARAARFLRLVRIGRARIIIPLPVVAEWWRGQRRTRGDPRCQLDRRIPSSRTGSWHRPGKSKNVDARLTIDAIVMATAALTHAIVVTFDPADFERLAPHFLKVVLPA